MLEDFSFILLHISAILMLVMFIIILRIKPKAQIHYIFFLNIAGLILWSLGLLLESYARNYFSYEGQAFLYIAYMGVISVPLTTLLLGLIFAHTKIIFNWKYSVLPIVPVTSFTLLITNEYHRLFYQKYVSFLSNENIYGPYFTVHTIFSYACILIGLYYLVYFSIKNSGFFSKQSIMIFIGFIVPFLVNIMVTLKVSMFSAYTTVITFTFTFICFSLAIFKYHFLNIVPIALQKVVDHISDSFAVLDEGMTIIDYNKAFIDSFKEILAIKRKDNFIDILRSSSSANINEKEFLTNILNAKVNEKSYTFEKHITGSHYDKYFMVEITPIYSSKKFIGTIILLKDITEYKKSLQIIKENQEMLVERERLASLGQLVGGIAHNMKTPIMSIAGGLEALKDLVKEYAESIDDSSVSNQDHEEIAQEMLQWIEKIKPHCSYMSDVISTVKGQAAQFNESSTSRFSLDELVKKIEILMRHELKMYHCTLRMDFQADMKTELIGEINSLIQALNNIITNAIAAYGGRGGIISFKIRETGNSVIISIEDSGKGIPAEIQNKLFKEMVTTKGKSGTGLGLYMSYSTIKGHFGGNMWFESAENRGTTFYITLPKQKAEVYQEVF